ncbi:kinase-like domain-containing protein [Truncatella angustata]|uniref:EKC/KEOPS complex subunit BUD32 n=1 Tax=Truncatella angustata TaxID=152316 RepID=A0A9P8RHX7_9PEZI|nr:kinase-like domain-containing protein [Truncatella angustata]KAH6646343.1 kinase-like domain-containing protein [Truncatella angustata]KAH8198615.1 hypothetical protein TruAng_007205 [Truncatella angustata]
MTSDSRTLQIPEHQQDGAAQKSCYQKLSDEHVEELELYRKNGLHPVHLGDVLNNRYEVLHKLGHGTSATVWLCFDTQTSAWKAIKIIGASHSSDDRPELKFQLQLSRSDLVALPTDHFWLVGPNGRHVCLVMPPLGPSVSSKHQTMDLEALREVSMQAADGLAYMHRKGICHGDFRTGNLLFRLDSARINDLSKGDMLALIGEVTKIVVETDFGEEPGSISPRYLVHSLNTDIFADFITCQIAVIGLSLAFEITKPPKTSSVDLPYASPQLLLRLPPSTHSDVWALGCTLLEMQTGSVFGTAPFEIMQSMELLLGPLPKPLQRTWSRVYPEEMLHPEGNTEYLTWRSDVISEIKKHTRNADCLLKELAMSRKQSLKGLLAADDKNKPGSIVWQVPEKQVTQIGDLIKQTLSYDLHTRHTADAVVQHVWFDQARIHRKPRV